LFEPPRYEIRTVADFYAVPESRRGLCLHDFRLWLDVMSGLRGLLGDIAGVHARTDVFQWIDDGKHDAEVNITVHDGAPPSAGEAQSVPTPKA
jgi:hypothetical protein